MHGADKRASGEAGNPWGGEEGRIRTAYEKRKRLADRYSWFNPGHVFIMQGIERQLLPLLQRRGGSSLEDKKIFEVGCGTGHWLREFVKWGARPENITGLDLLEDRIALAKALCPETIHLAVGGATRLDYPENTFDIVLQATVFTSILDAEMKRQIAAEMLRVVKPEGLIVWYDYRVNNPANPDVAGVGKREIRELFPRCRIDLRCVTLAPPLVRRLAPYSWLACYCLEKISSLCTHYLGVIKKE